MISKECVNCGALKEDHIYYPGQELRCPTTGNMRWREQGPVNIGARRCAECGKPKGVTFHVVFIGGKAVSTPTHPRCIERYRQKHGDGGNR